MTSISLFRYLGYLIQGVAVLAICVPFVLLLVWQAFVVGVDRGLAAFLCLCAAGVLTFIALLAAHELGHLLAGRAMGLPFRRCTVGLLLVVREGGRFRARLNTGWFQPAACVAYEPAWGAGGRLRWAIMVLGGPLSNLCIGVACLGAASWLNPEPPSNWPSSAKAGLRRVAVLQPRDTPTAYLNIAGMLSLGLGLVNLVPGREAGLRTDGGQLLDIWRLHKVAQTIGYPAGAVQFVMVALAEICNSRRAVRGRGSVQVSAREFCDYLLLCRGEQTAAILRGYNLRRSEDVGRLMFGLVSAGLVGRRESDSELDFRGLFALE